MMYNLRLLLEAQEPNINESKILELLKQIDIQNLNSKEKILLCDLLKQTEYYLVANSIAMIMEEFPFNVYKEGLLHKFFNTPKDLRGTLFFAMSSYDYSPFANEILDYLFSSGITDEESMSVYDLFANMEALVLSELFNKYSDKNLSPEQELIINTISEIITTR